MADQIEEGEIADVMVKESGKDRDRSRSKSSAHSRSRDNDRRMTKEDSRASDSSRKSSHKSDSKTSSSAAKDPPTNEPVSKASAAVDQAVLMMPDRKEVYEVVMKYESQLADESDVDEEEKAFLATCGAFHEVMKDVEELKSSGKYEEDELEELKMEGLLLLGKLRQLNRISKLRLKSVKDETVSCRQEVDRDHLLLQNLMYEAQSLKKQVEAVQSYKGQDEKIDLIPVEKFYQEAPSKISKPDVTKTNDHFLRIARLEYEFVLRQELTNQCSGLEKAKDNVAASIEASKKKLDSLRPLLNAVLESTKPVQDFFGMNLWKEQRELQTAHYLPVPLYVLFVQSSAYKDAIRLNGGTFGVRLCGDAEAAKEFVEDEIHEDQDDESDSDMECDDNENADADEQMLDRRKSRKGRKGRKADVKKTNFKKKVTQIHPLSVEWTLKISSGETLRIIFYYATKLQIVVVKSRIEGGVLTHKLPQALQQEDSILASLFPDDNGTESPNPVTHYFLQKADVSHFSELTSELGRPYIWSQKVAGLNFPPVQQLDDFLASQHKTEPSLRYSSMKIEKTVQRLLERLKNQAKLWTQIQAIESKNLSIPVGVRHLFPQKTSASFVSWELLSLQGNGRLQEVARGLLASKKLEIDPATKDIMFRVVAERGRARLHAFVVVGMNFPSVPPFFMLMLEKDGNDSDWRNDSAVKEMEAELNFYAPKEFSEWSDVIMILQIQRMLYCLDILLETDNLLGEVSGPSEFVRDKLISTPARGRNLRRPFQYKPGGAFSQRF